MSRAILLAAVLAGSTLASGCCEMLEWQAVTGSGTVEDPVRIPYARWPVTVDGRLNDWWRIGSMPLPHMKQDRSTVRFCWSEQGLYGAVAPDDAKIYSDVSFLYKGDAAEVFIEKDFARAKKPSAHTSQYVFAPSRDGLEGKGAAEIHGAGKGKDEDQLQVAWTKAPGGYVIEFLIPAKLLEPAKMQPGTKFGLDFAIDDNGKPVVEFFSDKAEPGDLAPDRWGAAVLSK